MQSSRHSLLHETSTYSFLITINHILRSHVNLIVIRPIVTSLADTRTYFVHMALQVLYYPRSTCVSKYFNTWYDTCIRTACSKEGLLSSASFRPHRLCQSFNLITWTFGMGIRRCCCVVSGTKASTKASTSSRARERGSISTAALVDSIRTDAFDWIDWIVWMVVMDTVSSWSWHGRWWRWRWWINNRRVHPKPFMRCFRTITVVFVAFTLARRRVWSGCYTMDIDDGTMPM